MILFWVSTCFHFRGVYVYLCIYIYYIHTYHGCPTYPSPDVSPPPSSWLFKNSLIAKRGQSSERLESGMLDEGGLWGLRSGIQGPMAEIQGGNHLCVHIMYQILYHLKSRWHNFYGLSWTRKLTNRHLLLGEGDHHLPSLWCNRDNLRESFKQASYCTYWPFEFASFCASHRCLWPFHPFLPSPALSPILFWYGTIEYYCWWIRNPKQPPGMYKTL